MNDPQRGRATHAGEAQRDATANGESAPDEAARLWRVLEKKQIVREGNSRLWLGIAMALGLAVLLVGLWIVVFQ